jgi:hypothetical protein
LRKSSGLQSIEDSWSSAPENKAGVGFQSWFDTSETLEMTNKNAERDFDLLTDGVEIPNFGTSCEIGFGGGRLVSVAAKKFELASGLDIHKNFEESERYVRSTGSDNFLLLSPQNANKLPMIDFFYSFIVIQHFEKLSNLEEYLAIIKAKLSANGVAVLCYGKLETPFFGDFVEVNPQKFRKRECSLYIRPKKFEELLTVFGFQTLSHQKRLKISGNPQKNFSMQAKIVFTHHC